MIEGENSLSITYLILRKTSKRKINQTIIWWCETRTFTKLITGTCFITCSTHLTQTKANKCTFMACLINKCFFFF